MDAWSNLSDTQQEFYTVFYAPRENNQRVLPQDNELIPIGMYSPTGAQINAVSDTGEELVRTINYRLTAHQSRVIRSWVLEHGDNGMRQRLYPIPGIIV